MKYKRYMVFVSDEYDNPSPFNCLGFDTDDKQDAIDYAERNNSYERVVFDRINGDCCCIYNQTVNTTTNKDKDL